MQETEDEGGWSRGRMRGRVRRTEGNADRDGIDTQTQVARFKTGIEEPKAETLVGCEVLSGIKW